jgi:hypothetical protein
MNLPVALLADDQGFATAHRHPLHQLRFFLAPHPPARTSMRCATRLIGAQGFYRVD